MFERFTDRARRVLVLAQEESRLLNHGFIGTEHILLGLIREGDGVAAQALAALEISLEIVRRRVEETIGLAGTAPTGSPPFTPRAKKVLELSLREALGMGHNYIGTEHILMGLAREGEGVAAQVLVGLGADLARVRTEVVRILSQPGGPPHTDQGTRPFAGQLVRCSFCGRSAPDSGRLVAGGVGAHICEYCIRWWSAALESDTPEGSTGPPGDGESDGDDAGDSGD